MFPYTRHNAPRPRPRPALACTVLMALVAAAPPAVAGDPPPTAGALRCAPPDLEETGRAERDRLRQSRRRFQEQELITASAFAHLINANQPPPRIIWRDVDEVRRLGSDGVLRVRWFDADLNESPVPNRPGRWGAYIEGTAPNGTPVRRAMTFYCRPPNFLVYFPAAAVAAAPHYQPGPIDAAVWAEHGDELSAAAAQAWFQSLNATEGGATLIAGLAETKPLGRRPNET